MNVEIIRNVILAIGWPVLFVFSIYIFKVGKRAYSAVNGSLVGKIIKVLVYSMLVEMYSLGIVSTVYLLNNANGIYIVLPIFIVWGFVFVWSINTIKKSSDLANNITLQNN
ncbi:MAG: hypothetical protein WCT33_00730 [Patescibacteria group bacterium]|jgi:hypothetical protein